MLWLEEGNPALDGRVQSFSGWKSAILLWLEEDNHAVDGRGQSCSGWMKAISTSNSRIEPNELQEHLRNVYSGLIFQVVFTFDGL